jgi:CxxC-x17-CxxC domain-containing protein
MAHGTLIQKKPVDRLSGYRGTPAPENLRAKGIFEITAYRISCGACGQDFDSFFKPRNGRTVECRECRSDKKRSF